MSMFLGANRRPFRVGRNWPPDVVETVLPYTDEIAVPSGNVNDVSDCTMMVYEMDALQPRTHTWFGDAAAGAVTTSGYLPLPRNWSPWVAMYNAYRIMMTYLTITITLDPSHHAVGGANPSDVVACIWQTSVNNAVQPVDMSVAAKPSAGPPNDFSTKSGASEKVLLYRGSYKKKILIPQTGFRGGVFTYKVAVKNMADRFGYHAISPQNSLATQTTSYAMHTITSQTTTSLGIGPRVCIMLVNSDRSVLGIKAHVTIKRSSKVRFFNRKSV